MIRLDFIHRPSKENSDPECPSTIVGIEKAILSRQPRISVRQLTTISALGVSNRRRGVKKDNQLK